MNSYILPVLDIFFDHLSTSHYLSEVLRATHHLCGTPADHIYGIIVKMSSSLGSHTEGLGKQLDKRHMVCLDNCDSSVVPVGQHLPGVGVFMASSSPEAHSVYSGSRCWEHWLTDSALCIEHLALWQAVLSTVFLKVPQHFCHYGEMKPEDISRYNQISAQSG